MKGLTTSQEQDTQLGEGLNRRALAIVHIEEGNYQTALEELTKSLELFESLDTIDSGTRTKFEKADKAEEIRQ